MIAPLRLGTRGSLLARAQSQGIADDLIRLRPGLRVDLILIKTTGDRVQDRPLYEVGGKGVFTKELELALLAGEIDFAVHSYKDMPVTQPLVDVTDLVIAGVPVRADARDVLIGATSIDRLSKGARVGTSSLRRQCQLLDGRPDLKILPLRGNIDTRLKKLRAGEFDAIVLAAAGLHRAKLFDAAYMHPLDIHRMLPAAGQGAIALQCRRDDGPTREVLSQLDHPDTRRCVDIERDVVRQLNGDCHSPIAALAVLESDRITLRVAVGGPDGSAPVRRASGTGPVKQSQSADRTLVSQTLARHQSSDKK